MPGFEDYLYKYDSTSFENDSDYLGKAESYTQFIPSKGSCETLYLDDQRSLVKLENNQKIFVNNQDTVVGYKIINKCMWEPVDYIAIEKLVNVGDNIIEIGSNIGWHTIKMASLIKGSGQIYSFEASNRAFQ